MGSCQGLSGGWGRGLSVGDKRVRGGGVLVELVASPWRIPGRGSRAVVLRTAPRGRLGEERTGSVRSISHA